MMMPLLKTALLSALALSLVLPTDAALAQRSRGRGRDIPAFAPGFAGRTAERSLRDIHKATEEAFRVERLAAQVSNRLATELTDEGYAALEAARTAQAAGEFFRARELAKAAKALFEAAETLYEGELGYKVGRYGQPEPPSRSYFDAPFRAQERLFRAQAELNFSGDAVNPVASRLVEQAQQLATANPSEVNFTTDFRILAEHRAAYEMAKAATHLLAAERGF
ncbi:hypothetical protein [Thermostichus vulcanus]|uniref:Uncharacterized protein n=1 Tax=Thermostichus vulcanus str. 'Rupite' TaxID=2813851 RepID=A0ABT0C839_THEVL|nr:hypothetical protein [Thermostichus vulcanus]MCJ2541525.1 hypothetical protein [Thermostichus vulcanus str. 'Rupite']